MMLFISVALVLLLSGGLASMAARGSSRLASILGAGGALAGCATGLVPAWKILLAKGGAGNVTLASLPWGTYGSLHLGLDALSAFFLLPILVLSALAAIYGLEYLGAERRAQPLGPHWLCFNVLIASMAGVVLARNAITFLVAWEIMALASFFLVVFEAEKESVREAGWVYLVATHIGTAFLLAVFLLLGREAGSLEFDRWKGIGAAVPAAVAGAWFLLSVVGFGTKAGFLPLHVWLPEAHPAAPSHVSAVMSGVMIKTGIYGLVRMLTFLEPPRPWWGWTLIAIGATSGVLGVLFALAQHDLKRLLAYHSVENIGIIALGLGAGVLGLSVGSVPLAVAGFGGGLLHVLNHALFKGLLFLGAGSVLHGTGTLEIDHLGGLGKRMPWTAALFLVGAVAISGLPPLNGFVSEFLIYAGAFGAVATVKDPAVAGPALGVIAALAFIGGLATACFTKAFGIVFLGEPRSRHAEHAHESGPAMRFPMAVLAACCLLIGLSAPAVARALAPVVEAATGIRADAVRQALADPADWLAKVVLAAAGLFVLIAVLAVLRKALLARRPVGETGTWDCGYARPTARMQYTASSFAEPLTVLFGSLLRTREKLVAPAGLFPREASLATETPDLCRERIFEPAFRGVAWCLGKLHWLQHGGTHLYVLYVVLTLVVLLIWKLG